MRSASLPALRRTRPFSGTSATVILLSMALAIVAGSAASKVDTVAPEWLMLIFSTAIIVTAVIYRILRRQFDVFEPLALFALLYIILYVARPAWDWYHGNLTFIGINIGPTFRSMLVVLCLAATGFLVGYMSPIGNIARRLPVPPSSWYPHALFVYCTVAVGIATLAFCFLIYRSGGFEDIAGFLIGRSQAKIEGIANQAAYLVVPVLFFVPASLFLWSGGPTKNRLVWRCASVVSGSIMLLLTALGGDRRWATVLLVGAVTLHFLSHQRRPGWFRILLFLFAALFILTFIRDARYSYYNRPLSATLVDSLLPTTAFQALMASQDSGMAPALAASLGLVPEDLDYTYGRTTLIAPFVGAIPRELWPGKPTPQHFEVIALLFGYENLCTYRGQCPTLSPFQAAYRDFGYFGVAAFSAAFGAFWRLSWSYYLLHERNLFAVVGYSTLLPFMILWMRGNFPEVATYVMLTVGVVAGAAIFSGRARN